MSWEIKNLTEVCDFQRGLTYKKSDEVEFSKNAVLRSNNVDLQTNQLNYDEIKYINDNININESKKVKRGSLLICMANGSKSHLGKVALIEDEIDFAFGGFMGLITPKKILNGKFLFYNLISEHYKKFIASLSDGANINNLKFSQFDNFTILVPPLSEQQKIVEKLDAAFALIDRAKANLEQNLQNAKELFQSKLNEVFSQKGEIWEEKRIKDLGKVQTGTTPPTKDLDNYGNFIAFIKPAHFQTDGNLLSIDSFLSEKGISKSRLVKGKSILMVCIGATIGKTSFTNEDVTCNQQINTLTPSEKFDYKFLYYGMISKDFQKEVLKEGKGAQATLPIINKSKWENLYLNINKSLEAQLKIVSQLDALSAQTEQLQQKYTQKLANLEELRKSVLEKAFRGE